MRIFNEDKTQEITEYDLTRGRLEPDTIVTIVPEQLEQQEVSHYETIAEYPNGGKEIELVIDTPYKPYIAEHEETEDILVYKPYTQVDINQKRIIELKELLGASDYKAIKFAEGLVSAEDYEPIKIQRQQWRDEINQLEEKLK